MLSLYTVHEMNGVSFLEVVGGGGCVPAIVIVWSFTSMSCVLRYRNIYALMFVLWGYNWELYFCSWRYLYCNSIKSICINRGDGGSVLFARSIQGALCSDRSRGIRFQWTLTYSCQKDEGPRIQGKILRVFPKVSPSQSLL